MLKGEKVTLTLPREPHRGRFCLRDSAEVTDGNVDYFTAWITSMLHCILFVPQALIPIDHPLTKKPAAEPSLYKVDVVSPLRTRNLNFSTGKRQSLTSNFLSD